MSSMTFMSDLFSTIADRGRALLDLKPGHHAVDRDIGGLAEALVSSRGEASGVALARSLLELYEGLSDQDKIDFFKLLVSDFGPDLEILNDTIERYQQSPDATSVIEIHKAAEPSRQELIRRLNLAPGGTRALVSMRKFLLTQVRENPDLKALDSDFHHLLDSWFNRGFLVMRRIDWNTPAAILEKIIRYEAVHAIDDWDDLRRRIDPPDRRCYAFFHPALVDEPLIFVEVAFTESIPDAISPILAKTREILTPEQANTAVFYSISNCQAGLRGISFGNFLIKQVIDDLRQDLEHIENFVTLSPVPGFVQWLTSNAQESAGLNADEKAALEKVQESGWQDDTSKAENLGKVLLPLAAHYFLQEKSKGSPYDPVARFHLGNGARLERINWLADRSDRGMQQAAGLMVNYLYVIADIESNHEAFASNNEVVTTNEVTRLFKSRSTR